jgi:transposase, IS30 family
MVHVTEEQRYTISVMIMKGYKQKDIAEAIGKDKSVVSREIKRNKDKRSGEYRYELAQRKYKSRMHDKRRMVKFTEEVKIYVDKKLSEKWSPEQISKTKCDINMVSHERIYQYIEKDKEEGGELYKNLRRKKKYKNRCKPADNRGKLKDCISIKERPEVVNGKTRVGDLEVDLIMGSNHKGAILTINDRKTGYAWMQLLKSKDSKEVANKIIEALTPYKEIIKTITSDNGKEFGCHKKISEKLEVDFYFAEPYSSWQRGANENLNGLIRQYFPKKTNFEELTWREVKFVQKQLNSRPRKRLGYETPKNEFNGSTLKSVSL